jgi:hypothetical protein
VLTARELLMGQYCHDCMTLLFHKLCVSRLEQYTWWSKEVTRWNDIPEVGFQKKYRPHILDIMLHLLLSGSEVRLVTLIFFDFRIRMPGCSLSC